MFLGYVCKVVKILVEGGRGGRGGRGSRGGIKSPVRTLKFGTVRDFSQRKLNCLCDRTSVKILKMTDQMVKIRGQFLLLFRVELL